MNFVFIILRLNADQCLNSQLQSKSSDTNTHPNAFLCTHITLTNTIEYYREKAANSS